MMNKSDVIEILKDSITNKKLCRLVYRYDNYMKYFFPLLLSDKFHLSSIEGNFEFCGYHIGKISDINVADTRTRGDKLFDIISSEGLSKYLEIPQVDLSSWKSIFDSLKCYGRYIIVKNEKDDCDDAFLVTGEIVNVTSRYVEMRLFDSEGEWDKSLHEIPYSKITSVEFGNRYCNVFTDYI